MNSREMEALSQVGPSCGLMTRFTFNYMPRTAGTRRQVPGIASGVTVTDTKGRVHPFGRQNVAAGLVVRRSTGTPI